LTQAMFKVFAAVFILSGQVGLATAQMAASGSASNQTALGIPEQGQPGYCAPKPDGTPGNCTPEQAAPRGGFNPASVPVLLGAVGAAGLGVAAATSGGGGRNGAPVSP
jgi:hypothetical protein